MVVFFSALLGNEIFHKLDSPQHHLYFFNPGYRLWQLEDCVSGMKQTGQVLIRYAGHVKTETGLQPSFLPVEATGDDLAIYYFVPLLVRILAVDVTLAYWILFAGVTILSYTIGSVGIILLFTNNMVRIISSISLAIFGFFCLYILDVYVLAFLTTSLIPLFLWIAQQSSSESFKKYLLLFLPISGIILGIGNCFRIHTGTGVFIFIALYLLFFNREKLTYPLKIAFIAILMISSYLPRWYLDHQLYQRDHHLRKMPINNLVVRTPVSRHVIWHSLYVGLSFIKDNKYGITWSDTSAYNKAREIKPDITVNLTTTTMEYEQIIRQQYLLILKKDPWFVIQTFLAKSVYVFLLLILFFNWGIIFLVQKRPPGKLTLLFTAVMAFYSLPGILVWPYPMYILGALSMAVYGAILILGNFYFDNVKFQGTGRPSLT